MWHALGDAVPPIELKTVAAKVFTRRRSPPSAVASGGSTPARSRRATIMLPIVRQRQGQDAGSATGFVKLFCRPAPAWWSAASSCASGQRAHPSRSRSRSQSRSRRTVAQRSRSTRRCPDRSPRRPAAAPVPRLAPTLMPWQPGGSGAGGPVLPVPRRRPDRVRRPRLRAAARHLDVLAQPPPVRLGEPGLAPLPRRPRPVRHDHPLRRAGLRPLRLGRRRLLAGGPDRRPRGGRRRTPATTGSRSWPWPRADRSRSGTRRRHPERVTRLLFYDSYAARPAEPRPRSPRLDARSTR